MVSKTVQCFCFKEVYEVVQCFYFKVVSKIVQCIFFKVVSKIVQCFLFLKQKAFVSEKGPLVGILMVSLSL